jgi:hypothetical protein
VAGLLEALWMPYSIDPYINENKIFIKLCREGKHERTQTERLPRKQPLGKIYGKNNGAGMLRRIDEQGRRRRVKPLH